MKVWHITLDVGYGGNSAPRNPNILKMFDFSERSDRVTLKLEVGYVI